VVHASSQTTSTAQLSTSGWATIASSISPSRWVANGHHPEVSISSTRACVPVTVTERSSPMSTTEMPFSRQHGS